MKPQENAGTHTQGISFPPIHLKTKIAIWRSKVLKLPYKINN